MHSLREDSVPGSFITYKPSENPGYMPELKLKQLQFESDNWKRLLGCMRDENVQLKNRLSDILKNGFNRNLLDEMENFQNRFIKEDERIGLLRHEVVELNKLLRREIVAEGKDVEEINTRCKRLRTGISIAEKEFGKLKTGFATYLSENI